MEKVIKGKIVDLFSIGKTNNSERDSFVSRFFGIFNERIAEIYFNSPFSEYENLGRPTLWYNKKYYTLDFSLKNKITKEIFVCEMKCEMQYNNYKQLILSNVDQILTHKKDAFKYFLEIGKKNNNIIVKINKKEITVNGIILLWGKISENINDLEKIKSKYNFYEILSLEKMINIMILNNYDIFLDFINERKIWINNFLNDIVVFDKKDIKCNCRVTAQTRLSNLYLMAHNNYKLIDKLSPH